MNFTQLNWSTHLGEKCDEIFWVILKLLFIVYIFPSPRWWCARCYGRAITVRTSSCHPSLSGLWRVGSSSKVPQGTNHWGGNWVYKCKFCNSLFLLHISFYLFPPLLPCSFSQGDGYDGLSDFCVVIFWNSLCFKNNRILWKVIGKEKKWCSHYSA